MRRLPTGVMLLLVLCLAQRALAQTGVGLEVTHDAGSEQCPDGPSLAARVGAIRGPSASPQSRRYLVVFTHDSSGYTAVVGGADRPAALRTIRAPGETCVAIAEAAAVALALLIDGDASPPPAPATEAPSVSPPAPNAVTHVGKDTRPRRRALHGSVALSGGLLAGVLEPVSPLLSGELGLLVSRFRGSVGVLGVPRQTVRLAPGTLQEMLLAGSLRGCAYVWRLLALRLDGCTGVLAGAVDVRASGFTRNEQRTRAWVSLPLELSLSYLPAPWGVELSTAALVALRRHDFSIDALGSAYDSWPVALSVRLHVLMLWP